MENGPDDFIERKIIQASIASDAFLKRVVGFLDPKILESRASRVIARWCRDFWKEYARAPREDIKSIFYAHLPHLDDDVAEWIGSVLESYGTFDSESSDYLIDQALHYLKKRKIAYQIAKASEYLERDEIDKAESSILELGWDSDEEFGLPLDPFSPGVRGKIASAFSQRQSPVIKTPKALGEFWDREMCRGAFVAIMGREKIGKTFMLIELAMRAVKFGSKVLFFQAGDMTEEQQLRRIAIWLAKRSDDPRYCNGMWIADLDCWWNLVDECDDPAREDSGNPIFTVDEEESVLNYDELVNAAKLNPNHKVCHNCEKIKGFPWLVWKGPVAPLREKEAYRHLLRFGKRTKGSLRILTYPNETLTVREIRNKIVFLSRSEGFRPDLVVIDYADILAPDADFARLEYRHQQNRIWQRLRSLSQEFNCLVLTATQIKADGYRKPLLTMSEFSEDKRKFAHVTAMYGLNQTPEEKRIGMMRINEIVVREADFDPLRPVTVLGRLQIGRPVLHSYRR
jgi:hypothetical protein